MKAALDTCAELGRKFPASKWIHECGALEIEIRSLTKNPVDPKAEGDDDLKLLALNSGHTIDVLKSPPREFRATYLRPLARADVPHMEARVVRAPLSANKGTVSKAVNIPIRFDAKSQNFMMSKEVMHGGKSVTVSAPISNHGGTLQSRGGSFAGGHGGSGGASGASASRGGGGSGGSSGGSHGGGSGGSSGGGSHGGGGGGSSSSSGSSGGGGSAGGGSHR
jgi:hypothetical protein